MYMFVCACINMCESRNWKWMDAGDCIGVEKLCQCIGRRGGNTSRTESVKNTISM